MFGLISKTEASARPVIEKLCRSFCAGADITVDTTASVSLNTIDFAYTVLDVVRLFTTSTFALKVAVPVTSRLAPEMVVLLDTVSVFPLTTTPESPELIVLPPDDSKSVVLLDTVNTLLVAFAVKFKPLNVVLPERNRPVEFARVDPPVA